MQTFKYFVSFYKPYKGMFFMDLLCAAVISAVDIAFPLIFGWCTGTLFVQGPDAIYHGLTWLIPAMLAMYILKAACRYYVTCQGHIMGARMETDMRRISSSSSRNCPSASTTAPTPELSPAASSPISSTSRTGSPRSGEPVHIPHQNSRLLHRDALHQLAAGAVSGRRDPDHALVLRHPEQTHGRNLRGQPEKSRRNQRLCRGLLEGIRVVQSFANEPLELRKFSKANEKYLRSKEANYRAMGAYYTGNHFFQGLLYVTIVLAGGLLAASHQISVGELATFVLYVNVFVSPLEILIELTEMFQKGFSGFRRFEEIMKEIPDIQDTPDARSCRMYRGNVEFRNVSFAYEDGIPVLENISFSIPAGKNVALAGPSGSGKTTICSLIPGSMTPPAAASWWTERM